MRKAVLASFILSPVLLHAQVNSPAKTELALASGPSAPATTTSRGTVPTKPLRISTGVVAPKLIHSVSGSSDDTQPWINVPAGKEVTVGMIIDPTGKPTDLKIVKS